MAMLRQCVNSALILWLSTSPVWAAAPTRTYSYVSGQVIDPSQVTTNEDNVFSYLQGGVDTYVAGSIPTGALADSSVTTIKLGNGAVTGAKLATMTNGQLPIGNGTSATFATLTGTASEIDITNAAGSITIGIVDPLSLGKGGTGLSTAADDTILNSNGTVWSALSVPNCTDTGGNHLNYTTASNTFSCGTTSNGSQAVISFSRTAAAGTGSQSVSGFGFAPQRFIVSCGQSGASERWSIGFASSASVYMCTKETDSGNWGIETARFIRISDSGETIIMSATVSTFDSDGITVSWTKTGAGMDVNCMILGER